MKKVLLIILATCSSLLIQTGVVYAARVYMDAPSKTSTNRESIPVIVYLDGEHKTISGVGGEFSFPSEMFTVDSIIAGNSVVSLWVTSPSVSKERYLDNRTHIVFDGIIPGGFSGVRTTSQEGVFPGVLFIVNLIPKRSGLTELKLDDIEIRAFDSKATLLSSTGSSKRVFIPALSGNASTKTGAPTYIPNTSTTYSLNSSEYVNGGKTYLFIQEANPTHLIEKTEYAEVYEYDPFRVDSMYWHEGQNPYILIDQNRSRYVHVRITYSDSTFTYITVPPVENYSNIPKTSTILIYIVIAVLVAGLYNYGKHYFEVLVTTRGKHS